MEEVERIDGLLDEYRAALASVRPRMEADALNREYGRAVESLRYDPDAPKQTECRHEDVMQAAQEIMRRFQKSTPP